MAGMCWWGWQSWDGQAGRALQPLVHPLVGSLLRVPGTRSAGADYRGTQPTAEGSTDSQ